ncbi:MAG TPA: hypothetical protein VMZ69_04360 [Saprospiraceae bacterium]|nr:hypothetical protein [Saprospiraceae bacterium]
MRKFAFLAISLLIMISCDEETVSPTEGTKYQALNAGMRELWSDHALWTRNVIINIVDGMPGTTEAVNRLLQNQEDIGDAIKPYYGDAGGEGLTTLLKEHITIAADLLTAAKAGDTPAFNIAHDAWYVNGNAIATFLNTANPDHFSLAAWKDMMHDHLDLTLEEATARLQGNYQADVEAYDKVYDELMMMADMLSEGIARQFPDKF